MFFSVTQQGVLAFQAIPSHECTNRRCNSGVHSKAKLRLVPALSKNERKERARIRVRDKNFRREHNPRRVYKHPAARTISSALLFSADIHSPATLLRDYISRQTQRGKQGRGADDGEKPSPSRTLGHTKRRSGRAAAVGNLNLARVRGREERVGAGKGEPDGGASPRAPSLLFCFDYERVITSSGASRRERARLASRLIYQGSRSTRPRPLARAPCRRCRVSLANNGSERTVRAGSSLVWRLGEGPGKGDY